MPPGMPKSPKEAAPSSPTTIGAATFDTEPLDVPGPSVSEHSAWEAEGQQLGTVTGHSRLQLSSINGETSIGDLLQAHQKPIKSIAELRALLGRLPPGVEANFGIVPEDSELVGEGAATGRRKLNEDLKSLLELSMDDKHGSERPLSVSSETLRSQLALLESIGELPALPYNLQPELGAGPRLQLNGPFGAVVAVAVVVRLIMVRLSKAKSSATRRNIEHAAKRASRRQSAQLRSELAFAELGDGCLSFTNSANEDRYRTSRLSSCYRQVAAVFVLLGFLDLWMLLSAVVLPTSMMPREHTLLNVLGTVSGLYRLCSGCLMLWLRSAHREENVERSWTRFAQASSPLYCALFCLFLPRASPVARPYQATYAIEAGTRLRHAFGGRMENCIIIILVFGALGTHCSQLPVWALFLASDVCSQLAELRGRTRWIQEQLAARVKCSQSDAQSSSDEPAHHTVSRLGATTGVLMRSRLPRLRVSHQTLLASLIAIVASRAFCISKDEDSPTVWAGFMSALALAAVCLAVAAYRLPLRHYASVWLCFLPSWALFTWSYMLSLSQEEFDKVWHLVQFKPTPSVLNLLFGMIHGSFPRSFSWFLSTYTCCYLAPDMLLGGIVNYKQLNDGASMHMWLQLKCIQVPMVVGIVLSSVLRDMNTRRRRHAVGGVRAAEAVAGLRSGAEVAADAVADEDVESSAVDDKDVESRAVDHKDVESRVVDDKVVESKAVDNKGVESRAVDEQLTCPITMELMRDPVITADGHTYERAAIESWMQTNNTSPLTGEPLEHRILTPNHIVRGLLRLRQE